MFSKYPTNWATSPAPILSSSEAVQALLCALRHTCTVVLSSGPWEMQAVPSSVSLHSTGQCRITHSRADEADREIARKGSVFWNWCFPDLRGQHNLQASGTCCKATSVEQLVNPRLWGVQLRKSSTNLRSGQVPFRMESVVPRTLIRKTHPPSFLTLQWSPQTLISYRILKSRLQKINKLDLVDNKRKSKHSCVLASPGQPGSCVGCMTQCLSKVTAQDGSILTGRAGRGRLGRESALELHV